MTCFERKGLEQVVDASCAHAYLIMLMKNKHRKQTGVPLEPYEINQTQRLLAVLLVGFSLVSQPEPRLWGLCVLAVVDMA